MSCTPLHISPTHSNYFNAYVLIKIYIVSELSPPEPELAPLAWKVPIQAHPSELAQTGQSGI